MQALIAREVVALSAPPTCPLSRLRSGNTLPPPAPRPLDESRGATVPASTTGGMTKWFSTRAWVSSPGQREEVAVVRRPVRRARRTISTPRERHNDGGVAGPLPRGALGPGKGGVRTSGRSKDLRGRKSPLARRAEIPERQEWAAESICLTGSRLRAARRPEAATRRRRLAIIPRGRGPRPTFPRPQGSDHREKRQANPPEETQPPINSPYASISGFCCVNQSPKRTSCSSGRLRSCR
jgi:hypothetical protein